MKKTLVICKNNKQLKSKMYNDNYELQRKGNKTHINKTYKSITIPAYEEEIIYSTLHSVAHKIEGQDFKNIIIYLKHATVKDLSLLSNNMENLSNTVMTNKEK